MGKADLFKADDLSGASDALRSEGPEMARS